MSSAAQRIMNLFAGYRTAHGTHGMPDLDADGFKWTIKRTAKTIREPVTLELWEQHLNGKRPLGVVPINEESMSQWGSIDVDEYDIDLLEIIKKVESMKLPLVPCRSKSGGLHLWLFTTEPVAAEKMQSTLRDIAASLGLGDCEIFPKQTKLLVEQGDQGNWMVMPYFGGDFGKKLKMQYGLKKSGAEMTINEFLNMAEKSRVPPDQLSMIRVKKPKKERAPFSDGPPCLQHMAEQGFPEDGKKRALFMMAIYLKRAFSSDWQTKLEEYNRAHLRPPLPSEEIQGVIKSVTKKDYEYTCKEQPMVGHCDAMLCRTRKYGVGAGGTYPIISGLSKLNTEPAMWFVDVEGSRLSMSTEDLQNYPRFHRLCMEFTHKCFKMLPQQVWLSLVSEAMNNMTLIEAPPDIGIAGRFHEILESWLTNRQRGENKEDILNGRPWEDEAEQRHYFKLNDLKKFLEREGMKEMKHGEITLRIQKLGGGSKGRNIKGKFVNLWWVPSETVQHTPDVDPPEVPGEPI